MGGRVGARTGATHQTHYRTTRFVHRRKGSLFASPMTQRVGPTRPMRDDAGIVCLVTMNGDKFFWERVSV